MCRSAGGGGYGNPFEREIERVARDVQLGYISEERARTHYGVILRNGKTDVSATVQERRRAATRAGTLRAKVSLDKEDRFVDGRRIVVLAGKIADLAGLEDGQLAELVAENGAPLRAWVERSDTASGAELGPVACDILQVGKGDSVAVRAPLSAEKTASPAAVGFVGGT